MGYFGVYLFILDLKVIIQYYIQIKDRDAIYETLVDKFLFQSLVSQTICLILLRILTRVS